MASLNRVFLIGNLTRDPELRYIPSGQAVTTLRMASSRTFRSQSGEQRKDTLFIDVVVWGKQAENAQKYLRKGSQVFVEGRLRIRDYEGRDGTKRHATEIVATFVQYLDRAGRSESAGGEYGAEAPAAPEALPAETAEEPMPGIDEEEVS